MSKRHINRMGYVSIDGKNIGVVAAFHTTSLSGRRVKCWCYTPIDFAKSEQIGRYATKSLAADALEAAHFSAQNGEPNV